MERLPHSSKTDQSTMEHAKKPRNIAIKYHKIGWLALILLLHWTTTRSLSVMTAAEYVKIPGEIRPAKIEIEIGDSANITCRIPEGEDISQIWFRKDRTSAPIEQPNPNIIIVDNQTAILTIRNATEHTGDYQCLTTDGKAIGQTKVHVGKPPQNVTDFSCRVYNYVYMRCNFTDPKNMLFTSYVLNYTTPNVSGIYNCELNRTLQVDPSSERAARLVYVCIVKDKGRMYMPGAEFYDFRLIGSNALATNVQRFKINNHASVIPSKLDVKRSNATSDSIMLSWRLLYYSYYSKNNLKYEILVKPDNFDWYRYPSDNITCCAVQIECEVCTVKIEHLAYAHWNYTYAVHARVRAAPPNDDSMWSDKFVGRFETKAERPAYPPAAANTSFYLTDTEFRLYWKEIEVHHQNGANFIYTIDVIDPTSNRHLYSTATTKQTSITFRRLNDTIRTYSCYIRAANDVGTSLGDTLITVFTAGDGGDSRSPNRITTSHNGTYTLFWEPPKNTGDLEGYHVFWCAKKGELKTQCKGTIEYETIAKDQWNFTPKVENQTLNLAIAAIYPNYSTGMHWALCAADVHMDLMKLEPEMKEKTAHSITVRWSLEFSFCSSILLGYNLSYCQVPSAASASNPLNCTDYPAQIISCDKNSKMHTIEQLKPFTKYRIDIFMYSKKIGPLSDPLYIRTDEAAPSPPRDLQVDATSIRSNAVNISWLPPATPNGLIKYYKIWKSKETTTDSQKLYVNSTVDSDPTKRIQFTLDSLNSFSNYTIAVTAHTMMEHSSPASNSTRFRTQIGIPTPPSTVKIDGRSGDLKEITWMDPEMPSGRVEFYVVALVKTYKTKGTGDAKARMSVSYSQVMGHGCTLSVAKCGSSSLSEYTVKVRAVNVANNMEFDQDAFNKMRTASPHRKRHTNPMISSSVPNAYHNAEQRPIAQMPMINGVPATTTTTTTTQSTSLHDEPDNFDVEHSLLNECVNKDSAVQLDPRYDSYLREVNMDIVNDGDMKIINYDNLHYLHSAWSSVSVYRCEELNLLPAFLTFLSVTIFGCIILLSFILGRWKFNKMSQIGVKLPEAFTNNPSSKIENGTNASGYPTGYDHYVEKDISNISRSHDCLVSSPQFKGIHDLLMPISRPAKIIPSHTRATATEHDHDVGDYDSHGAATHGNCHAEEEDDEEEEHSSESTDSLELNEMCSSSQNYSPMRSVNTLMTPMTSSDYQEAPLKINAIVPPAISPPNAIGTNGGYDTLATLLLATTGMNAQHCPPPPAPAAAPAAPPQPPAENGYVLPESVNILPTSTSTTTTPTTTTAAATPNRRPEPCQDTCPASGYTTIESLGSFTMPSAIAAATVAAPNATIPRPSGTQGGAVVVSKVAPTTKDIDDVLMKKIINNNNNNNNNNTTNNSNNLLNGYVTQTQLAEIGQMLH